MLIRVPVVSSASEQRRNNLSSVQSSPWISTCPSETQSMTSLPVSLAPQPSAILSRAVSGARMRLLFVSTTCPFWIISSRMMWTRSRLNMIWWRGAESKKPNQTHTWRLTVTPTGCSSDGRIRPVHSVGTKTQTQWSDWKLKVITWLSVMSWWTHHPAEVFIQNLHEVVNQLVDGQLVLWRRHNRHVQLLLMLIWRGCGVNQVCDSPRCLWLRPRCTGRRTDGRPV